MFAQLLTRALEMSGANAVARRIHRGGVAVLMYHGVMPDDFDIADGDWLQVRESEFRNQMRYLSEHYRVVPLERAWEPEDDDGKPRVALTFDDGYANNFNGAFNILREFEFPATIFLVTSVIGSRRMFWFDRLQVALRGRVEAAELKRIKEHFKAHTHPHEIDAAVDVLLREKFDGGAIPEAAIEAYRPLNREEIQAMAESGLIRFGSHTHRHEILTQMSLAEAENSLGQSVEILKNLPGYANYFCFPNGGFGPEHVPVCRRLGFDGAVLTCPGFWEDGTASFGIPRFGIGRGTDTVTFAATVSGVLPKIRQWVRR